jgi:AraC-like DNA-binding protein
LRVAIFLPDSQSAHVRAALETQADLCVADSWEHLETLIRLQPLSAVVFSPAADGTMDVSRACRLIRRYSSIPFVAYVPLDAPFARVIAHMSNDGLQDLVVVRANDSPAHFRETIVRVSSIQEYAAVLEALQPWFRELPKTLTRVLGDALVRPHRYPSAEAIAAAAGMTVSALYRSFRKARLNSPKSFVVGAHVFRGYLYLQDIGFSIRDIAAKLGYTHPRIFAHQIEHVLGERPSTIRKAFHMEDAVERLVEWFSSREGMKGEQCPQQLPSTIARLATRTSLAIASALLAALPHIAEAQAPIEPVDFRPFSDGRTWIVKQPMVYRIGVSRDSVVIPAGFVTDMASIPPVLQSIIQQNGPYQLPAIVHDYLYWRQTCTRQQSDRILLLGMTEHHVGKLHRTAIYDAVRAAGQFAWDANAGERTQHLLRIIPADRLNIPSNTLWPEYRTQLMQAGGVDPPTLPIPAKFCARGSMSTSRALTSP